MANVALSLVVPVEVRDALRALASSLPVPVKPATLAAHLLGVAVRAEVERKATETKLRKKANDDR